MSTKNTGGPAFPTPNGGDSAISEDGHQHWQYPSHPGMSLRDWFAGKALEGEMAAQSADTGEYTSGIAEDILQKRASLFYRFADAMLKEREK